MDTYLFYWTFCEGSLVILSLKFELEYKGSFNNYVTPPN